LDSSLLVIFQSLVQGIEYFGRNTLFQAGRNDPLPEIKREPTCVKPMRTPAPITSVQVDELSHLGASVSFTERGHHRLCESPIHSSESFIKAFVSIGPLRTIAGHSVSVNV
jgi:hypothetical protein